MGNYQNTLWHIEKKVPWPWLKKHYSGRTAKKITRRLTDSWVQQMKTTCYNGKHLRKGNRQRQDLVCLREGISKHSFHLQGPVMTRTHLHRASGTREKRKVKIQWAITHALEIDGQFDEIEICQVDSLKISLVHSCNSAAALWSVLF